MIAVLGLGFVGLTTALGFAEKGLRVCGFDVNVLRRQSLNAGRVPFFEPKLEDKLRTHLGEKLQISGTLREALSEAEVIFLCMGTPSSEEGRADLKYIRAALDDILVHTPEGLFRTIVVKSTVPPGATHGEIWAYLENAGVEIGADLGLAINPEFLREGHAWDDFMYPDRIVLGVYEEKSRMLLERIYADFGAPIHVVSISTAEFVKYLSNALLANLISFSNEMAMIAAAIGDIDVKRAFRILHEDKRWSGSPANMTSYVWPGAGFGGYCLPKDTAALISRAADYGVQARILDAILRTNEEVKAHIANTIMKTAGDPSRKIGILGLSFKPGSGDVRASPSAEVIWRLNQRGFRNVVGYDPIANREFAEAYPNLKLDYAESLTEIRENADILVLLTAWPEFTSGGLANLHNVLDFRFVLPC